jgi:hypothetical protein
MSAAFAPGAARTALAPDGRARLSDRTVRTGTSTCGARLATADAGARLPAAPALVAAGGRMLLLAACPVLEPRSPTAVGWPPPVMAGSGFAAARRWSRREAAALAA